MNKKFGSISVAATILAIAAVTAVAPPANAADYKSATSSFASYSMGCAS